MECRLWRLFRCAPHVEMRVPCAQIRCNAMVVEQRCCCCQEEEAAQGEQLLIGAGGVGDWRRRSGFRHWNFRRLKLLQTMYRELIIVRLTAFYLRMALRSHPQTCSSSDTAFSFFFFSTHTQPTWHRQCHPHHHLSIKGLVSPGLAQSARTIPKTPERVCWEALMPSLVRVLMNLRRDSQWALLQRKVTST
jgi:hypothetical protein